MGLGGRGCAVGASRPRLELCPPCSLPAEPQRSGDNTSQNCDIPGFLKLGWSAKHLPVVRAGGGTDTTNATPPPALEHPPPPSPPSLLSPKGCWGLSPPPLPPGQRHPCATLTLRQPP